MKTSPQYGDFSNRSSVYADQMLAQCDRLLGECGDLINQIRGTYAAMQADTELALALDKPGDSRLALVARNNDALSFLI